MEWKTKAFTCHYLSWTYDLAWFVLNTYEAAIEVHQRKVEAGQGIEETDLFGHVQVSSLSLEEFARFDLDNNNYVACFCFGNLVSFSVNGELLALW